MNIFNCSSPKDTPACGHVCTHELCKNEIHCTNKLSICVYEKKIRDDLDFVRKEVHFENNILAQRLFGFIVCQSLLMTPFFLSFTLKYENVCFVFDVVKRFTVLLSLIGILTSVGFFIAIHCAVKTIDMWCAKSLFLKNIIKYNTNIRIERESEDFKRDGIHRISMQFYYSIPIMFFVFWFIHIYSMVNLYVPLLK